MVLSLSDSPLMCWFYLRYSFDLKIKKKKKYLIFLLFSIPVVWVRILIEFCFVFVCEPQTSHPVSRLSHPNTNLLKICHCLPICCKGKYSFINTIPKDLKQLFFLALLPNAMLLEESVKVWFFFPPPNSYVEALSPMWLEILPLKM